MVLHSSNISYHFLESNNIQQFLTIYLKVDSMLMNKINP
jgi:hypothetical protein